jgi:hypothetical protein
MRSKLPRCQASSAAWRGASPRPTKGSPSLTQKLSVCVIDTLTLPVERCIPSWHVHTLNRGGHLTLTNVVMSLKPVYTMAALPLPTSTIDRINKLCHTMFWKGVARCSDGDLQVAWMTACRPGKSRHA